MARKPRLREEDQWVPLAEIGETLRLNLRLTPEMLRKLERAVAENGTSLQTEIVKRLEQSFSPDHIRSVVEMAVAATLASIAKSPRRPKAVTRSSKTGRIAGTHSRVVADTVRTRDKDGAAR